MEAVITEHIEITPGVCGGKPRIAGHRIRVQDIVVWHERLGHDPEEIVRRHPTISLGDVYAALAYYDDHREQIRNDIAESESLIRDLRAAIPSKVAARLAAQREVGGPEETGLQE
jgi:uncharacterized protein (DUF433 family)